MSVPGSLKSIVSIEEFLAGNGGNGRRVEDFEQGDIPLDCLDTVFRLAKIYGDVT